MYVFCLTCLYKSPEVREPNADKLNAAHLEDHPDHETQRRAA